MFVKTARTGLTGAAAFLLLYADQLSEADRVLLETAARVVLDGTQGSLTQQLQALHKSVAQLPAFIAMPSTSSPEATTPIARPRDLVFDNGLGGFSADGREYVIYLEPGRWTPAPWINVIANPEFGFTVSETGAGYTWFGNSSENRLTPWSNDPIIDPPGEAIYLRDEETAEVWSPTPLPCRAAAPYLIRHGAGYSIFEHNSHGLAQQLAALCDLGRAGQGDATASGKHVDAPAAHHGDVLRRMGAGCDARHRAAICRLRI